MWALIRPKARHVVTLAIVLPLLLLTLYFVTKSTEAYEEAERFVSADARVVDAIGRISRVEFKFWEGFEFTGSEANFSYEVMSEKGAFTIEVHLRKTSGKWHTETASIRAQNGMEKRIVAGIRQFSLAAQTYQRTRSYVTTDNP
jgi:hypothetical protein